MEVGAVRFSLRLERLEEPLCMSHIENGTDGRGGIRQARWERGRVRRGE